MSTVPIHSAICTLDKEARSLYVAMCRADSIQKGRTIPVSAVLDVAEDGTLIGVEIFDASFSDLALPASPSLISEAARLRTAQRRMHAAENWFKDAPRTLPANSSPDALFLAHGLRLIASSIGLILDQCADEAADSFPPER